MKKLNKYQDVYKSIKSSYLISKKKYTVTKIFARISIMKKLDKYQDVYKSIKSSYQKKIYSYKNIRANIHHEKIG
jgi:hypothetical protein